MSDVSPLPSAVDLTNCDREPIHVPGAIQPHGALLVLREPGLEVVQASANAEAFFGRPVEALLGSPLDAVLPATEVERLRAWLPGEVLDRPVQPGFSLRAGRACDAILHRSGGALVLELEPCLEADDGAATTLQRSLERLQQATGFTALCDVAAHEVQRLTGFDRVMVYRFDADWHGDVVAEARVPAADSYLGLRFPASDIPQQARRLYTLNRLRLIPDVGYTPAPLVPPQNPLGDAPFDLSFSVLRSVSPIHLEYLRNMGVGASMSISLVREGRLWGLIACHHAAPLHVPYRVRTACELLGQVLVLLLATTEEGEDRQQQLRRRDTLARLLEAMVEADDFVDGLAARADDLLGLVGAQGAAVVGRGRCLRFGEAPAEAAVRALAARLEAEEPSEVFATDHLARGYPEAVAFREQASGVLAIALSRLERYAVLWFRPEVPQTVYWAGNPHKAVTEAPGGQRLHPRTSFQAWQDTLRGHSERWTAAEVEAAHALRRAISDVVFVKMEKLARLNASLEAANAALTAANEQLRREVEEREQAEVALAYANRWLRQRNQELQEFAYIASHDLQEPLRKIQSFGSLLQAEYADRLDGEGQHYVSRMTGSAERLSALIADLLSFSRVVTHAEPFEEVNLQRVVEWVLRELGRLLTDTGAALTVGPLPSLQADPAQMRRLFHNLVSNAVRFHRPGVPPVVRIDCEEVEASGLAETDGRAWRITIEDNGVGFDEKYLDRIFQPFQRLHPRESQEGTGIGLAISKRIVERHGGTLTARSTPGSGSTFIVTLPFRPPRAGAPPAA